MLSAHNHITRKEPSSSFVCKLFAQAKNKAFIKIDESLTGKGWAHQGMILGPPDYERQIWPFLKFIQLYLNSIKPFNSKGFSEILASQHYFLKTTLVYFCLQIVCTLFGIFPCARPPNKAFLFANFTSFYSQTQSQKSGGHDYSQIIPRCQA